LEKSQGIPKSNFLTKFSSPNSTNREGKNYFCDSLKKTLLFSSSFESSLDFEQTHPSFISSKVQVKPKDASKKFHLTFLRFIL